MTRIALVTGAGSGVGRAATLALLQDGWSVVLAGRRRRGAGGNRRACPAPPARTLAVATDVTRPDAVAALFDAMRQRYGRLDLLFNNAGGNVPATNFGDLTFEQWTSVVAVNLNGCFLVANAAFRHDARPDAAGRAHHQQRLDFGARAAAGLGGLYRHQARHHRAHQVDLAGRAGVRHRLRPDRHRQRRDADDPAHGAAACRRPTARCAPSRPWMSTRSAAPSSTWPACRRTRTCSSSP